MRMVSNKDFSRKLFNLVKHHNELENSMEDVNPIIQNTFKEVYKACREESIDKVCQLKIDSVVDYLNELLHIGHWSTVPLSLKKAFYSTSFLKVVVLLQLNSTTEALYEALKCTDLGILLGAPLENDSKLLTNTAMLINRELIVLDPVKDEVTIESNSKRKHNFGLKEFDSLNAIEVACKSLPSIECFMKEFYIPEVPVKIKDSISHWPALNKWPNISYILNIAGGRTVPVEIGSQYSDENWSQKLMTLREFIEKYYLSDTSTIGYLAQHNLLDQIPELKDDICVPEYCVTSRNVDDQASTLEINAWFGPKGTVSSLHFDPKDNLLAQVYGTKLVTLFSPEDSKFLYPHTDQMLCNTSQVNPNKADLDRFPEFRKAKMMKCLLEPGDVLYMPPKWWHYVVALEKSFSVNFWWT